MGIDSTFGSKILGCSLVLAVSAACTGEPRGTEGDGDVPKPGALSTSVNCETPATAVDERVCRILGSLRRENDLPGLSAAILLQKGERRAYTLGWADAETGEPMTADTRMLAGSIGKTFVAALALALAEEEIVDLDAPVSVWLGEEEWFRRIPYSEEFTLRLLLSHTSGITDHWDERFATEIFPRFTDPDYVFEPEDLFTSLPQAGPGRPPGGEFQYTDTAFNLAALTLARAGGRPYFEQVERRFLRPLGLEHTEPQNGWAFEDLAQGYFPRDFIGDQPEWVVEMFESVLYFDDGMGRTLRDGVFRMNPVSEYGGGGFVSTPSDLAAWARAFYGGSLIPGPYLEQLVRDAHPDPHPTPDPQGRIREQSYGLGTWVMETRFGRAFGHGGYFPGYLSAVAYFEEPGLAVAIQTNRVGDVDLSQPLLDLAQAVLQPRRDAT